jgi:hypothetical protein
MNSSSLKLFFDGHYASEYPAADIVLVDPPDYFLLPANVSTVWLRSFGDHEFLLEQARARNVSIQVF